MKYGPIFVGALALSLIMGLTITAPKAEAQEIVVDSADPSSAPQATTALVVLVRGRGFDRDSWVDFFETDSTKPGGITVTNVVFRGSRKLEVTIDVAAEATVGDFDIEVSSSNGRRGRGTELFRVVEMGNGGGAGNTITYDVFASSGSTACVGSPFVAATSGTCTAECGNGSPGAEIPVGGDKPFNIWYCGCMIDLTLVGEDDIEIVRAGSNMQVDDSTDPAQAFQFGFSMIGSDGKLYEASGQIRVEGDEDLRAILAGEDFVIDVDQPDFPVRISRKSGKGGQNRDRGTICIGTLEFIRR